MLVRTVCEADFGTLCVLSWIWVTASSNCQESWRGEGICSSPCHVHTAFSWGVPLAQAEPTEQTSKLESYRVRHSRLSRNPEKKGERAT